MGNFLSQLCRAAFAVGLASTQVWCAAVCKVLGWVPFLSVRTREGLAMLACQLSWRLALLVASPWVKIQTAAATAARWRGVVRLREEARANGDLRPFFFVGNHVSFLDTLLNVSVLPASLAFDARGYIGGFLLKMPVLGTILRAQGAFPVFFTGTKDGDFRLDRGRMAAVEARVDAHLAAGGTLCFFPEGQQNKAPDTLLPFRYGGMKRALACDARVWALVAVGNERVWPKTEQVGGFPGTVRYGLMPIAPDGCRALAAELAAAHAGEGGEEEEAPKDYQLLATHMRATMQSEYDSLKAVQDGKVD